MADLDALETQGAWGELVDHLGDILPSKRDAHWQALAEKSALGYVDGLATDKDAVSALGAADDLTHRYPTLKKSRAFMSRRGEVGIKGFETCFDHDAIGGHCTDRLLGFVDADAGNTELALAAGKLVLRKMHPYVSMPFFRRAIAGRKGAKECGDEGLGRSTVAALGLPDRDTRLGDAKEVASNLCWDALHAALIDQFVKESRGSYYVTNTCDFLKAKNALSKIQASLCNKASD
jgi:hypothetical protein